MNAKRWGLGLALLAPLLGGCAASDKGPSFGNLGRNFAGDWTAARGFDRATLAQSHADAPSPGRGKTALAQQVNGISQAQARGGQAEIKRAGRALNANIERGHRESILVAQSWMNARLSEANIKSEWSKFVTSPRDAESLRRESNASLQAALAFLPGSPRARRQLDPQTLNSLGFMLAEQGQNKNDFQTAERLTAIAFELLPARNSFDRFQRAQTAQDSRAWALFKLGRIKEALDTQETVMQTLHEERKHGLPQAEIVYHMGAIYRVAGMESEARAAFKNALELGPSPELRETLEAGLAGKIV